jgi:hypothetical protein
MQGKMGVLLATICRYDRQMFEEHLVIECPYVWITVWDIFWVFLSADPVKEIPPMWEHHLGPCACLCIAKGWRLDENFFVVVLMIGSSLGAYSNCLAVPGEEPSPVSGYFSFGALGDHLVVGFLGGIVPVT